MSHPRNLRVLIPLMIIVWLLAACASSMSPSQEAAYDMSGGAPIEEPAMEAPAAPEAEQNFGEGALSSSGLPAQRIVIQNASLTIVVDEPPQALDAISAMAIDMGGFVVNANLYQMTVNGGVEVPRGSVTVRVPSERLQDALAQIEALSNQLPENKTIESQDVTSEYTDLQSRLRNLENTEAQLTRIMEDANRTEDVLAVYNQLVSVREQIEVIKGQIKYYEESAALSAIRVELLPNEAVQPLTIAGWQPGGVARDAVQALINTFQVLVNVAIWLVIYALPVLAVLYLVIVLPIQLLFRAFRRRRARSKAVSASAPPSPEA